MLEGKVISLGKATVLGGSGTAKDLASDVGARIAGELAFTLGVGAKPTYLSKTNNIGDGIAGGISAAGAKLDSAMGGADVRARIEPATEANLNLLPAIDGIQPNEVEPITETRYINTLLF